MLYPDLAALRDTEPLQESIQNTGAVVMGRNSFDMAEDPDSIAENYEYQVPIFVLVAGDKDVSVIGAAGIARQCFNQGLADEMHVDIMPLLLGGGRRLFEDIDTESIQLERLKVLELPTGRTHLRFRIIK